MYSVCDGGKDHRERVSFALNAEPLSHSDSGNRVLLVCLTATLELLYGLLCYAVPHVLKSTVPQINDQTTTRYYLYRLRASITSYSKSQF